MEVNMHNSDYKLLIVVMAVVIIFSGCTPHTPEIWNVGWRGALTAEPQTDL
jgi:hypothetical protein